MGGMERPMTREEYIKHLFATYSPVSTLSTKNGCKVLRLRNKTNGRDLVLRSFPEHLDAYETLCGIRCDNLPEIYDAIDVEDGQIVLEEYIDGITVSQVLDGGKYRYRGAKKVLSGVCHALQVLHDRGLVHRDVKPENVMIGKTGRVVLIDFNASRRVSVAQKDTVILGTVGYAAPEQLGITQSDARTDLYAAGVMLNVMLTGFHPSQRIARGKPGRIVRKCTAINPSERYSSASQLQSAL